VHYSQPFFSIIVPVINAHRTIDKCIQSVLQGNHGSSYELLIFDGGSTDGTINLLEKYKDFISHLRISPDKGPHFAVNEALKFAKGEVIIILCSDDYLENNSLVKIHQKFIKYPDLDLLSCGIRIHDESGNILSQYIKFKQLDFNINNIIKTPLSHGRFIKKRIYELQGGFPLKFSLCNDLYFLLNIKICHKIKTNVLEIYAYNYLSHPQSSTMGNNQYKIIDTYIDNFLIASHFITNYKFNIKELFNFYSLLYKSFFKFIFKSFLLNRINLNKFRFCGKVYFLHRNTQAD